MGQNRPLFVYFRSFHNVKTNLTIIDKNIDGVLGTRTRVAGLKVQTNPLSYGGTLNLFMPPAPVLKRDLPKFVFAPLVVVDDSSAYFKFSIILSKLSICHIYHLYFYSVL